MLEIYSRSDTAGTIVHCALEFADAPHELVLVTHGDDGTITPSDYLELNPSGTVPTLVDGELVLYETVAILEYLVEEFPGLGPRAGEPGRAEFHFWLGWLTNNVMATMYRWFKADEMSAPEGIDALKTRSVQMLTAQGEWVEDRVSVRDWLVDGSPSAADLFLQGLGGWADEIDGLTFGGEAVAAHAARTLALPGVRTAIEQEG